MQFHDNKDKVIIIDFGSQVTKNLINLLNALGEQGIAALIIVFAVIFAYRKILKQNFNIHIQPKRVLNKFYESDKL